MKKSQNVFGLLLLLLLGLVSMGATCGPEDKAKAETPKETDATAAKKTDAKQDDAKKPTVSANIYPDINLGAFEPADRQKFVDIASADLCPCPGVQSSLHECLQDPKKRCPLAMQGANKIGIGVERAMSKTDILNGLATFFKAVKKTYEFRLDGVPVKGNPSAKVVIVEFADFECPMCAKVSKPMGELAKKYGDQVAIYFKNFPLAFHPNAKTAAYAALAAHKQGKFWEMHDLLFENQKALGPDMYKSFAQRLGLNYKKLQEDMKSPEIIEQVNRDKEDGDSTGLDGTPTIFVNGKRYIGGYEQAELEAFIDAKLAEASK